MKLHSHTFALPNIKFRGSLIEQWLKLHKKIEVKGYQVIRVMYTTEYLLKNATTVTELCIKEKEEFRIWKELKRAFKEIETDMENKNIQEESNIKLLRIGSTDIMIECEVIRIIKGEDVVTISKLDFHKKPRHYINLII